MDNFNPIWTSLIQFGQVWSNLDVFDPICTSPILFGQVWSKLDRFFPKTDKSDPIQFGQVRSYLDQFNPFWTGLIQFGQVWSIMDRFDPIWTETFQNIPEKLKKVEIKATTTTTQRHNLRVETTFRHLKINQWAPYLLSDVSYSL